MRCQIIKNATSSIIALFDLWCLISSGSFFPIFCCSYRLLLSLVFIVCSFSHVLIACSLSLVLSMERDNVLLWISICSVYTGSSNRSPFQCPKYQLYTAAGSFADIDKVKHFFIAALRGDETPPLRASHISLF